MIAGVVVKKLKVIPDERGLLMEMWRSDDPDFERFGQVYVTMVYPGFVATGVQGRGFGPDGKPLGKVPIQLDAAMPTATCARIILRAAALRKREEVMTMRGKLGQWLKLIAPGLVDQVALQAIKRGR